MNPLKWLARWVPERDGRAARLPLCLFGMLVTGVQTIGFALNQGMPLLAVLPFPAFCVLGGMAACDACSLIVDLWRWCRPKISPAQVEAAIGDATFATRRYTRQPARATARSGGGGVYPRASVAQVSAAILAGMPCPPTVH